MRKARKMKRRSCGLCKPWKMGGSGRWEGRWKPREFERLRRDEKEMQEAVKR